MNFFGGIFGLLVFIADVWAIASILRSPAGTGSKILWVLLVAVLPVLGLIIWWFAGPKADGNHRV